MRGFDPNKGIRTFENECVVMRWHDVLYGGFVLPIFWVGRTCGRTDGKKLVEQGEKKKRKFIYKLILKPNSYDSSTDYEVCF